MGQTNFLWNNNKEMDTNNTQDSMQTIAQDQNYRPKAKGGFGFKRTEEVNGASCKTWLKHLI